MEASVPQVQDSEATGQAQPAVANSASGRPTQEITTAYVGTILPVPGGKGTVPKPPYINFTALELESFPDLPGPEPNPLAEAEPWVDSNTSSAKPAVCARNPTLSFAATNTPFASTCRAYLYLSTTRRSWTMCTAWFVSPIHVALAGHCVGTGGTGRYSLVAAAGRYGTICCRTQSNTGPDTCPSGYGLDIVQAVTTSGWLNRGLASNDAAVLKVRRPSNLASGVGTPLTYGPPNPFCPATVSYLGYPASDSRLSGCNTAWGERLGSSTTSGAIQCYTSPTVPSLVYPGSSCGGMSGGPMYNPTTNVVNGILVQSSTSCANGRSNTLFSVITSSSQAYGVWLASLVSAIP